MAHWFCRLRREDGATAVLISLLTFFVLLPLAALGTNTFVRAGALAELTLAADAGALAGAANIPVGDIEFLAAYIDLVGGTIPQDPPGVPCDENSPEVPDEIPCDEVNDGVNNADDEIDQLIADASPNPAPSPRDIACDQARAAIRSNGQIGNSFDPDFDSNATDEVNYPKCEATYMGDLNFVTEFADCVDWATGDHSVTDTVTDEIVELQDTLRATLGGTLPGLLNPGIKVTLTRGVTPPLEFLIDPGNRASDQHEAVSYARRRFKNAIVLPIVPGTSIVTSTSIVIGDGGVTVGVGVTTTAIDLSDSVGLQRDEVLTKLDDFNATITATDGFPSECSEIIPALRGDGDFVDVANPRGGNPDSAAILKEASETDSAALVLILVEGTPFFDFVQVCEIEQTGQDHFVGQTDCAANAPGAFRATLVPPI